MGKLSEWEKEGISRKMRGLALTRLQAEVSNSSLVLCHNCGYAKPLIGAPQGQARVTY